MSTNLPSSPCVACPAHAVTSLKLNIAEADMQQGVRKLHHRDQCLPSRARGRNRASQQGRGARGKPDLLDTKLHLHYANLVNHRSRLVTRAAFCPSSLFPLPQKYILVCNWPLQTLHATLETDVNLDLFAKKSHSQRHQDARQGSKMAHFFPCSSSDASPTVEIIRGRHRVAPCSRRRII